MINDKYYNWAIYFAISIVIWVVAFLFLKKKLLPNWLLIARIVWISLFVVTLVISGVLTALMQYYKNPLVNNILDFLDMFLAAGWTLMVIQLVVLAIGYSIFYIIYSAAWLTDLLGNPAFLKRMQELKVAHKEAFYHPEDTPRWFRWVILAVTILSFGSNIRSGSKFKGDGGSFGGGGSSNQW